MLNNFDETINIKKKEQTIILEKLKSFDNDIIKLNKLNNELCRQEGSLENIFCVINSKTNEINQLRDEIKSTYNIDENDYTSHLEKLKTELNNFKIQIELDLDKLFNEKDNIEYEIKN